MPKRASFSPGMPTWYYAMHITKPNQQLRQELKELGLSLEESASEVLNLTKDCQGADVIAALKLIAKLYEDADRLATLADEVRDGKLIRP